MAGLEFFSIVGGALAAAYFGLKLNVGPFKTRQKLGLWAGFLGSLAVSFGLSGGISILRILQSDRPTIQGTIQNINIERENHGTYNTHITLQTAERQPITLRIGYHGSHLRLGLPVAVTYLASHSSVLELKSLDPDDHGWVEEESDGLASSRFSLAAGSLFAIAACVVLLVRRSYHPQRSKNRP